MLKDFTASTFAKRVGNQFTVRLDDDSNFDLELVSVTPGLARASGSRPQRGPFSILFCGPPEPILPQRIYQFENHDLGAFEIFIVPIGYDNGRMQYEAVFG